MNEIWDFISRVYTNILMTLMGDAHLDMASVLTIVVIGSAIVGVGAMVALRMMRPTPLPPIIVNNAAPPPNPMIPVMISAFILFVVVGGGIFIYLAR
jgi:hypothetical protein